jgi:cytoskeletal protein CcmA (bactofilin family)
MFERNKRDGGNEESNSFPAFEARENSKTDTPLDRGRDAAVIGPSIQIKGDLSGEEDLVIQGKVNGTIQLREKSLTVGSQGQVNANVLAHSIIVEGEVKGDLYGSERVSIRKTGNVQGNIVSPKVSLEEGCRFKGSIDMDQEMINKAFEKKTSTSSTTQPESSSSKSKSAQAVKLDKNTKSISAEDEVKTGVSGSA